MEVSGSWAVATPITVRDNWVLEKHGSPFVMMFVAIKKN